MNSKKKKTKGKTKTFKPEDFTSKEAAEEALEEYIKAQPIYNYFQFFIGGPIKTNKNNQEGKPPTY